MARICLTHVSFIYDNEPVVIGKWDGTEDELERMLCILKDFKENEYDMLIKLCDYISLPQGFCLLEKRIVDMTIRSGFTELTIPRWKSTFEIKSHFENKLGCSIYELLPNVIETTFDY